MVEKKVLSYFIKKTGKQGFTDIAILVIISD